MFGLSTVKLIGLAIAAAAILSFVTLAFHWKSTMTERGAQLSTICAAIRAAADNPKMDCRAVPQQIGELGKSIANLKAALADQNAKVVALGAETVRQRGLASQAAQEAAQRAKAPARASDSLQASARAPERLTKPCEPSDTLKGAWQ
jgi:hypothetical protein